MKDVLLRITHGLYSRLAGAARVLRNEQVYSDGVDTNMSSIARAGITKEVKRLERKYNGGQEFRSTTPPKTGRPRRQGG